MSPPGGSPKAEPDHADAKTAMPPTDRWDRTIPCPNLSCAGTMKAPRNTSEVPTNIECDGMFGPHKYTIRLLTETVARQISGKSPQ